MTATHHHETTDPLDEIAARIRDEARAVRQAFAELDAEGLEAWQRHTAEARASLDEIQRDLDEARERLAEQRERDRAQAREALDELLATLHGRYDDLWVQLRLAEMETGDQVQALRSEAERIVRRGRSAVEQARRALRQLTPQL